MTDTRKPDGTHRVAITGVGALSPAGVGVDALMGAVNEGRRCIAPITRFDTQGYPATLAAEIPSFDAQACGLTKKEARRFAPFVQYAIVAADEAMASSGLSMRDEDPTRVACVWGSGIGGLFEFEAGCKALHERGPKRVSPLFIPTMIENMAAGNLSIRYGMKGDCLSIVTACATGAHCVGEAYRLIRHGYADAALAGGSEESISPVCLAVSAIWARCAFPTTPTRRPCRSMRTAAASCRARERVRSCWNRSSTRSRAARASSPKSQGSAPRATPIA